MNSTEYRDPSSIKEDGKESSTDSNHSSNYSLKVEADELSELLDSILVGIESRRNSLVDLINTNSDHLDVTTPHFDENPSYPVDHPEDHGSIRTTNNIDFESLSAPQEFTEEIVSTIRESAGEMASSKIREPSMFHGAPEEEATDWLASFEEISKLSKSKPNRLTYIKLYLEGTARQWILEIKPVTFFNAFKQTNFKFRLETRQ